MMDKCANCKHYDKLRDLEHFTEGFCRQAESVNVVLSIDWCDKYENGQFTTQQRATRELL